MNGFYSIAIDGPSGAGKSTLAKKLASAFSFIYVDTGAIYRTVGLAVYRKKLDPKNEAEVKAILPELEISMMYNEAGEQCMLLNGEDVSKLIRMPEISLYASDVSAHGPVRSFLLEMQRKFARESNVIMDGRDIGTVVLPDAELKIYLTADVEVRAKRRFLELQEKGVDPVYEDVLEDMKLRDWQDMNREVAPLKKADDAIVVDSSNIGFEETFQVMCDLIIKELSIARED
jgi:cytidylate kinase